MNDQAKQEIPILIMGTLIEIFEILSAEGAGVFSITQAACTEFVSGRVVQVQITVCANPLEFIPDDVTVFTRPLNLEK